MNDTEYGKPAYDKLSEEKRFVQSIFDLVDSQSNITPEFTSALRSLVSTFMKFDNYSDISSDLSEYVGTLDDVVSGRTSDKDWIAEFRKSLVDLYLK